EWLSEADIRVKYAAMAGGEEYAANLVAKARSQPNPLKGGPRLYRVCSRVVETKREEDRQEKGHEVSAEVMEGGVAAEHVRAAMARSLKRLGSDASGGPKPKRRQRALTDAAPAGSSATPGSSATADVAATAGRATAKAGADPAAKAMKRKQTTLRARLNTLVFNIREVIAELGRVGVTEGYGLEDAVRNLPLLQQLAEELDDILLSRPEQFHDFCLKSSAPIALAQETLKRARSSVTLASKARAAATAGA
ncbi:MAG: hypothetical protein GY772_08155, partial [bacterium]|nr:hypothetical protein [bacterium]